MRRLKAWKWAQMMPLPQNPPLHSLDRFLELISLFPALTDPVSCTGLQPFLSSSGRQQCLANILCTNGCVTGLQDRCALQSWLDPQCLLREVIFIDSSFQQQSCFPPWCHMPSFWGRKGGCRDKGYSRKIISSPSICTTVKLEVLPFGQEMLKFQLNKLKGFLKISHSMFEKKEENQTFKSILSKLPAF